MTRVPSRARLTAGRVVIAVVIVVVIVAVGSVLYWAGEGRPRSPAAFRELVAATGLDVDWTNNGPRGGDGLVATDCDRRAVSVDELDGDLWVSWNGRRAPITPAVIDELGRCDDRARGGG